MKATLCDRCGKIIEKGPIASDLPNKMGILRIEIGPFQKKYRLNDIVKTSYYECLGESASYDICDECVESFKTWLLEINNNSQ